MATVAITGFQILLSKNRVTKATRGKRFMLAIVTDLQRGATPLNSCDPSCLIHPRVRTFLTFFVNFKPIRSFSNTWPSNILFSCRKKRVFLTFISVAIDSFKEEKLEGTEGVDRSGWEQGGEGGGEVTER